MLYFQLHLRLGKKPREQVIVEDISAKGESVNVDEVKDVGKDNRRPISNAMYHYY